MPSAEWRCAIMKPACTESPLGLFACRMFMSYLAGVPTTVLSAHYEVPAARINRGIKRTAKHLLAAAGSEYEKKRPIVHLSRMRNEASLWLFRLALTVPRDVIIQLCCTDDGFAAAENASEYLQTYGQLRTLLLEHLQRWSGAPASHEPGSEECKVTARKSCGKKQAMESSRI